MVNKIKKKVYQYKEWLIFIISIFAAVAVSLLVYKYLFYLPHVIGSSMENNFHNGDMLFCTRVYGEESIDRYDVVMVWYGEQNMQIVKRVYGLPGEVISVDERGCICIDGKPANDPYGKEPMENKGILEEPVVLGEGEFFLLGDNRNNSDDSRFGVGIIKFADILGKVRFKLW